MSFILFQHRIVDFITLELVRNYTFSNVLVKISISNSNAEGLYVQLHCNVYQKDIEFIFVNNIITYTGWEFIVCLTEITVGKKQEGSKWIEWEVFSTSINPIAELWFETFALCSKNVIKGKNTCMNTGNNHEDGIAKGEK